MRIHVARVSRAYCLIIGNTLGSTRSERRDGVQRFTNVTQRQPASRHYRFIAPIFLWWQRPPTIL